MEILGRQPPPFLQARKKKDDDFKPIQLPPEQKAKYQKYWGGTPWAGATIQAMQSSSIVSRHRCNLPFTS